jgi:hypothetical protein
MHGHFKGEGAWLSNETALFYVMHFITTNVSEGHFCMQLFVLRILDLFHAYPEHAERCNVIGAFFSSVR